MTYEKPYCNKAYYIRVVILIILRDNVFDWLLRFDEKRQEFDVGIRYNFVVSRCYGVECSHAFRRLPRGPRKIRPSLVCASCRYTYIYTTCGCRAITSTRSIADKNIRHRTYIFFRFRCACIPSSDRRRRKKQFRRIRRNFVYPSLWRVYAIYTRTHTSDTRVSLRIAAAKL